MCVAEREPSSRQLLVSDLPWEHPALPHFNPTNQSQSLGSQPPSQSLGFQESLEILSSEPHKWVSFHIDNKDNEFLIMWVGYSLSKIFSILSYHLLLTTIFWGRYCNYILTYKGKSGFEEVKNLSQDFEEAELAPEPILPDSWPVGHLPSPSLSACVLCFCIHLLISANT